MSDKQKIGWVGLGKMGIPMSANLLKAGYPVAVWNRTASKTKECADAGASVAGNIGELAGANDVIISMISDDSVLESVASEVMAAAKAGTIFIDMSTVSPAASARVAEAAEAKGVKYLRAPVSGSTALAQAGTLTIFASGPKDAYDAVEPVFLSMGQKAFHVGTAEEARYLKLVLNMMVGLTAAMAAEALAFGEKGGMDWAQMLDIVSNSVVASPLIGYKVNALKEKNFAPAFTAAQMAKDFGIALETGGTMGMPMPLVGLVSQYLNSMKATGKGDNDFFGLLQVWEEMGGLK
jgi:3-hydroxyisobutyrate dehydrogenase-like beta-hydroxyacid dehydrogenase